MPSSQGPARAPKLPIICATRKKPPMLICFFMCHPSRCHRSGSSVRLAPFYLAGQHRRIPRMASGNARIGLEHLAKLASNSRRVMRSGIGMTYCCGVLVRDGLVMIADTRTNAGLDNVSTFRKLHVFSKPGERIMAIASAGNLAISQSVLSTLTEGLEDPHSGEIE